MVLATEIAEFAELHRILLFALIAKGDTDRVRDLIDETLQLPVGDDVAGTLTDLRHYVGILDGRRPAPDTPFFDVERDASTRSVSGLIAEALRRFLRGEVEKALGSRCSPRVGTRRNPPAAYCRRRRPTSGRR